MKFELIKLYPGVDERIKIGDIAEPYGDKGLFRVRTCYSTIWTTNYFSDFPEFWKPIVEKEYEILSFYVKSSKAYVVKQLNGLFICPTASPQYLNYDKKGNLLGVHNEDIYITDSGYTIHSIKRLSDGEIFTVGDKINGTMSIDENLQFGPGYTFIKSFEIEKDELVIHISTGSMRKYQDKWSFRTMYKYIPKQPLFITEDGVDMYKGDKCFSVDIYRFDLELRTIHAISQVTIDKYFSTKQKAIDYIIENKPCLSIKDILKAGFHNLTQTQIIVNEDNLRSLVKKKTKL